MGLSAGSLKRFSKDEEQEKRLMNIKDMLKE